MKFEGIFTIFGYVVPMRAYLHTTGKELYGREDPVEGAAHHLRDVLNSRHTLRRIDENRINYLIPIIWGDMRAEERVIDFFGYCVDGNVKDKQEWQSVNPDVLTWVTRNGLHFTGQYEKTCGDTLILLGEEEKYRRRTRSLQDYLPRNPPSHHQSLNMYSREDIGEMRGFTMEYPFRELPKLPFQQVLNLKAG